MKITASSFLPHTLRTFLKRCIDSKFNKIYSEKKRIRSLPRYQNGNSNLLTQDLKFTDGASFLFTYEEVFEKEIYCFKTIAHQPFIIDCGANIGLSVIYFKQQFNNARIVAFEPDPVVSECLKMNLENFGLRDVQIIQSAVWKEDGEINFHHEGADAGRIELMQNKEQYKVKSEKLSRYLTEPVSFLKLDIEGAESEVLPEIEEKLHLVEKIFIEYHSFKNKPQRLSDIFSILERNNFRYYIEHIGVRSELPYIKIEDYMGMDLQLNIFAFR